MTNSNFTPLGDRVLVRPKTETEKKSKGEASIFRGMSVEDNLLSIIEIKEKDKTKQNILLQNLLNEFDINHVRK
jgi:co-chaperonin GroES (HSP10)